MEKFEKLGDFKKAVKATVRGAIKAGVFGVDGKYVFTVTTTAEKGEEKHVSICAENGAFCIGLDADVSTRVFNKVEPVLFEPIIAQFEKLNKVESIVFAFK